MPYFESPALYIDFSRLPPPAVIEEIDSEVLIKNYQDKVVELNPALAKAVKLEQSPTNIILETQAYGETLTRQRVNRAAQAVMLPFAMGSDLDNLAAFWNLARAPIVDAPRSFLTNPEDWESDERLRSRAQGAAEAMTMAGTAGSYRFHAMQAVPTLRDASAICIDDMGGIQVTVMAAGANPTVSAANLAKVRAKLEMPNIKPLTDVVSVASVTQKKTAISADVTLYPGPDSSLVRNDIEKALKKLLERISWLGRDLTRSAVNAALFQEGVLKVEIQSPAADIICDPTQCAVVTDVSVRFPPLRAE